MPVTWNLVIAARAADPTDALDLDLAAHRIAEGLARRLVLTDRPRLEIHVDHVRLIGKVVEIHPLQDHVLDAAARFLHDGAHVDKALVGLRGLAHHRLGGRQVPRDDHRREDVVAQARGVGQRIAVREPFDFDTRAPLVGDAKRLQFNAHPICQRKRRGFASRPVGLLRKQLQPAGIDVRRGSPASPGSW